MMSAYILCSLLFIGIPQFECEFRFSHDVTVTWGCEEHLKKLGVSSCYNHVVFLCCPKLCNAKKNGITDCQWGDKSSKCDDYSVSSLCDNANNRKTCCYKCRNYGRRKRSDVSVVPYDVLLVDDADLQEPIQFKEIDVIEDDVIENME